MVWMQLLLLPHTSVAVQVRKIVFAAPQLLLTESLKRTVTAPHKSWALATPVMFVLVSAGQSSTRFGGQTSVGGVESRTVIVCRQLTLLPHVSVAVQVRETVGALPQLVLTESL